MHRELAPDGTGHVIGMLLAACVLWATLPMVAANTASADNDDRRQVGTGVGVREAAADRAPVANLRVADPTGGVRDYGTALAQ